MSGPIVRTGTTPAFWQNWEGVFGKGKKAGAKATATKSAKPKAAKAKSAKKTAAPKKKKA